VVRVVAVPGDDVAADRPLAFGGGEPFLVRLLDRFEVGRVEVDDLDETHARLLVPMPPGRYRQPSLVEQTPVLTIP
jgi:hypothetical protein